MSTKHQECCLNNMKVMTSNAKTKYYCSSIHLVAQVIRLLTQVIIDSLSGEDVRLILSPLEFGHSKTHLDTQVRKMMNQSFLFQEFGYSNSHLDAKVRKRLNQLSLLHICRSTIVITFFRCCYNC